MDRLLPVPFGVLFFSFVFSYRRLLWQVSSREKLKTRV